MPVGAQRSNMCRCVILWLCVSICGVICDLSVGEGADCVWEGVQGKCVEKTRCMTTLATESPEQPVCSNKGEDTLICCTDCELVNDTRNAVVTPTGGIFWKDGRDTARDHCLHYIKDLPYRCHENQYTVIGRNLDSDKMCHKYYPTSKILNVFLLVGYAFDSESDSDKTDPADYPHKVLLGYEDDSKPLSLESAKWMVGGTIISDRYILTAAHLLRGPFLGEPKYVAANVQNSSYSYLWQTHRVKRLIRYPEYKPSSHYNDIGLIETETPIEFDENVLPACLHVDDGANDEVAVGTNWRDFPFNRFYRKMAVSINAIRLDKSSEEECKSYYGPQKRLKEGYNHSIQMCYGKKVDPSQACLGDSGEPLMIDTQFSRCVHTVIGVTSFGISCDSRNFRPDVHTRVFPYVPWIESVVWP